MGRICDAVIIWCSPAGSARALHLQRMMNGDTKVVRGVPIGTLLI